MANYLHEIALHSYVVIQAEWPAVKARQVVMNLEPAYIIVHRVEAEREYYYLYSQSKALEFLDRAEDDWPVIDAFNLHEYTATDTFDAYADAAAPPGRRGVILDEGRVVGYYDPAVPLGPPPTRGGDTVEPGEPVSRSLVGDFPERVRLHETKTLLVSLSAEPAHGEQAVDVTSLPRGATVKIIVQPKRGFVLVGTGEKSLTIQDVQDTLPLPFELKATELGPGRIHVLAFHEGQPLGRIVLAPTVEHAEQAVDETPRSHKTAVVGAAAALPDLRLLIMEEGGELAFRLYSPDAGLDLFYKKYNLRGWTRDPQQYFEQFFDDIDNLPLKTPSQRKVAERRLAAKGADLFAKVVPEDLQAKLWSLQEHIQSVQVASEEPYIPWELCKLHKKENGRVVEGPFLCEVFAITRWLLEEEEKPSLKLSNMALVLPKDCGLPFAPEERDYILGLANGGRKVTRIPATSLDVLEALETGVYDGWHFTGHGRSEDLPDRSTMVLQQGENLSPEDLSGVVANLGLARPVVFLNACQIGRTAMSLTDIGGWAPRFVHAGAAAFIGAYWSVYDQAALEFARAFYGHLLAGMTIGEAARQARLAIKPDGEGDPTWLAYTVYAHPLAKVQA